eukprot:2040768-Amphidinium_carterae.1
MVCTRLFYDCAFINTASLLGAAITHVAWNIEHPDQVARATCRTFPSAPRKLCNSLAWSIGMGGIMECFGEFSSPPRKRIQPTCHQLMLCVAFIRELLPLGSAVELFY